MITALYLLYTHKLYLLCCEIMTGLQGGTFTHSLTWKLSPKKLNIWDQPKENKKNFLGTVSVNIFYIK